MVELLSSSELSGFPWLPDVVYVAYATPTWSDAGRAGRKGFFQCRRRRAVIAMVLGLELHFPTAAMATVCLPIPPLSSWFSNPIDFVQFLGFLATDDHVH
jgi:hypothetical protein